MFEMDLTALEKWKNIVLNGIIVFSLSAKH